MHAPNSFTDMGSSGEVQPQGDIVYMCASLLGGDGLAPLLFHVGLLVQPDFSTPYSLG